MNDPREKENTVSTGNNDDVSLHAEVSESVSLVYSHLTGRSAAMLIQYVWVTFRKKMFVHLVLSSQTYLCLYRKKSVWY